MAMPRLPHVWDPPLTMLNGRRIISFDLGPESPIERRLTPFFGLSLADLAASCSSTPGTTSDIVSMSRPTGQLISNKTSTNPNRHGCLRAAHNINDAPVGYTGTRQGLTSLEVGNIITVYSPWFVSLLKRPLRSKDSGAFDSESTLSPSPALGTTQASVPSHAIQI
ncbi:hypothetical protein C8R45DRAFT_1109164 [Mycena sanguinolenta]|nr:hypothetical protein C8R45DRAFT_1109164 [Mycena sanguinolenta]